MLFHLYNFFRVHMYRRRKVLVVNNVEAVQTTEDIA